MDVMASARASFVSSMVIVFPAGGLLGFLLAEIGPSIYNQAVADAQQRLHERVTELDIDVHEEEFDYWRKFDARKGKR